MIQYKVGTNFDLRLIDEIEKENRIHKRTKVTELYGSVRQHADLAARPDFRLPDVSRRELEEYIQRANDAGLVFNYTINSIQPYGSKLAFAHHTPEVVDTLYELVDMGVGRFTVANPMLLELMKKYHISGPNGGVPVEISTIAHVDTITQIKYYHEVYDVTKICANVNKNRNFNWLKPAAEYCKKHGIILELMANEFCGVGGDGYATHCIYRDSCYICHSTNHTKEDAECLNNYPMEMCTQSRNVDGSNWLKSKFIRPEDVKAYEVRGIDHFKLTGRTGSTEYLMKVIRAYMDENFNGNLLELWKPLESITQGADENFTRYNIPNKALDGFIDYWTVPLPNGQYHDCDNQVCGETCKFCNLLYSKLKREANK